MRPAITAVAGLLLAASAAPARASCAFVELGPELITRAGAKIPSDGGILVGVGRATDLKPGGADPSQVALTGSAGGKAVSLVMASLAPGLTVYRPKPAVSGALTVRGGKSDLLAVTFGATKGAALPVPVVTAITTTMTADFRNTMASTTTAAVTSVPDAAVALIVYAMVDEEHVPITFGVPAHDKAGATTVVVYHQGGHCSGPTIGAQRAPSDAVSFAWVDAYGRLSPVSAPVQVTSAH